MPVQAGSPVAGSMMWWRGVPSSASQARAWMAEVATAPAVSVSRAAMAVVERVGDVDLLRRGAADAQVAAAVDAQRSAPVELGGGEVGDVALARPAEVEPQARRTVDDPGARARRRSAASAGRDAERRALPGPSGSGTPSAARPPVGLRDAV